MNELKNPIIEIDGETIEIIPNEFTYVQGKPVCSFCKIPNKEYVSIKRNKEINTICIVCVESIHHALKLRQDQKWRANKAKVE
jgi:hypothetical protein